jgi:hypothetical protein
MDWHLTEDGPPVVPAGEHGIEVWVAYEVIGGWNYDKDYCSHGVWTVKKPDRWAYIVPPCDDVPDTDVLAERYLLKRGWVALGGGKTEDGVDIPAALHQWVNPDYRWLAPIVGTDRAVIVQAAREVSRYLEMLYQAGDLDAEGAYFVAKPEVDEL